ncbi:MAG: DUF2911 domain-containing protein, partial [Gemmatimonadaceae bacterium]
YGLFLEVQPKGAWTWIISRSANGWGAYQYDAKDDVVRVNAEPSEAPFTEYLTYNFDDRSRNGATLQLQWELKRVALRIDVPNALDLYVQQMRKDLLAWPGFDTRNWQKAATFCASNRINLEEALVWADLAINGPFRGAAVGEVSFGSYEVKALVLNAMGRTAAADSVMAQAFDLPGNDVISIYSHGARLLSQQRVEQALRTFKVNEQKHPKEPFWLSLGYAQGYTASGDTTRAIAQWERALRTAPEAMRAQVPRYEAALSALRKGGGR